MTIFAKRHYEAIALVCQEQRLEACLDSDPPTTINPHQDKIEARLAAMFKADNPAFDRDRFLLACLPGSNVKAKTAHLRVAS